jgi:hypothetical protein
LRRRDKASREMKTALMFAAIGEVATGVALLIVP